ncbi:hypothetical protein, partial [Methanobrevibacter sp. V74]|uniref:hypothetical protein n=1 Tax=Methanobrevibacter sp. V74 TaxID=3064279 RepID=UPI002736EE41
ILVILLKTSILDFPDIFYNLSVIYNKSLVSNYIKKNICLTFDNICSCEILNHVTSSTLHEKLKFE